MSGVLVGWPPDSSVKEEISPKRDTSSSEVSSIFWPLVLSFTLTRFRFS